jgi:rhamnosyltransferase
VSIVQQSSGVVAVVVAYHPDHERLLRLVEFLHAEVDAIVVVDNTDGEFGLWSPGPDLAKFVTLMRLGGNHGVGRAQNVGIVGARAAGARHVLLLDQDSLPVPGMVEHLLAGLGSTTVNGRHSPLVAGPVLVDERTGEHSTFLASRDLAISSNPGLGVVAARLTIASGMLIDVEAFDLVGMMREDYFIDWIDVEWVMRLYQSGFYSVGVLNAFLQHNEGERLKSVWFVPGKKIPYHQPFRNYYRVRNQLLIFRDLPVGLGYKLRRMLGLLKYLVYFTFFADRRLERLRFMLLGFWDGLRDVRGPLFNSQR